MTQKQFSARISDDAKRMLEELAKKDGKSLTKELEYLIKKEYVEVNMNKKFTLLFKDGSYTKITADSEESAIKHYAECANATVELVLEAIVDIIES